MPSRSVPGAAISVLEGVAFVGWRTAGGWVAAATPSSTFSPTLRLGTTSCPGWVLCADPPDQFPKSVPRSVASGRGRGLAVRARACAAADGRLTPLRGQGHQPSPHRHHGQRGEAARVSPPVSRRPELRPQHAPRARAVRPAGPAPRRSPDALHADADPSQVLALRLVSYGPFHPWACFEAGRAALRRSPAAPNVVNEDPVLLGPCSIWDWGRNDAPRGIHAACSQTRMWLLGWVGSPGWSAGRFGRVA